MIATKMTTGQKAMARDGAMTEALTAHTIDALCSEHGCQMAAMDRRNDTLEAALQSVAQWADAYPLDIFPEPDLGRARELLEAGGITLDSISASCMRHVVKGVGAIAREALEADAGEI